MGTFLSRATVRDFKLILKFSDSSFPRYTIEPMAAWDFINAEPYLHLTGQPIEVLVFGSLAARHAVARQALMTLLDRAQLKVLDVSLRPPFNDAATLRRLLERADWVKVNEQELRAIGTAGRAVTHGAINMGLPRVTSAPPTIEPEHRYRWEVLV